MLTQALNVRWLCPIDSEARMHQAIHLSLKSPQWECCHRQLHSSELTSTPSWIKKCVRTTLSFSYKQRFCSNHEPSTCRPGYLWAMETCPVSSLAAHQSFIKGPEGVNVLSPDSHPGKDTQVHKFRLLLTRTVSTSKSDWRFISKVCIQPKEYLLYQQWCNASFFNM